MRATRAGRRLRTLGTGFSGRSGRLPLTAGLWALLLTAAAAQAPPAGPAGGVAAARQATVAALPAQPAEPAGFHAADYSYEARLQDLEARLYEQQQETESLRRALEATQASHANPAEGGAAPAEGGDGGYVIGSDLTMKANWKDGFEVTSANKDFRFHAGGRTQFDGVWFDSSDAFTGTGGVGDADAVNFRRARFRLDGTFYEVYDWVAEFDFVNSVNDNVGLQPGSEINGNIINVTAPTDLYWNIKEIPLIGNFRIGNVKEPIGMEHLTSSRYLDFMERSFLQDAFVGAFNNGFTPGMTIFNWTSNERATWALGAYKITSNVFEFNTGDGEYAVTGRATWTPWFDEPSHGRYLWHVGGAFSHRDLDEGRLRYRSRASLRNGPGALNPIFADTGFFLGDKQTILAAESALNLGPLLLQGEYMGSLCNDTRVGANNFGTVFVQGAYAQALYFLTGESRHYETRQGVFGRVVPNENAYLVRSPQGSIFGRGAWQLAARYDWLDLRDGGIDGGVLNDVTLGLNWFINPNMKVQWNYVWTHRNGPGGVVVGDIQGAGMRIAHDF